MIIYDPLTHQPFPNNRIPANRINPVSAKMIGYLPLPDTDVDNGTANYNRVSLINNKFEQEYAVKVEHKFTDKVSLTGFYLYNRTDEPVRVMMWSTVITPAATVYPDSDKIGIWTGNKADDLMVRRSGGLEYFDGET